MSEETTVTSQTSKKYKAFYRATLESCTKAHKEQYSDDALAGIVDTLKDVRVDDYYMRSHAIAVIRVASTWEDITQDKRDDFYALLSEMNPDLFEFHKEDNKHGHFPHPKFP